MSINKNVALVDHSPKYKSAYFSLLAVVLFTLVNIVMASLGNETYFLFSATVPYFIAFSGALYCGLLPDYYYTELGIPQSELLDPSAIVGFAVVALIFVAVYFVVWLLSKNKRGFMIAALVLFIIDTVAMFILYGIALDSLLDILFHGWVIVSLIMGINEAQKVQIALRERAEVQESESVKVQEGESAVLYTDGSSQAQGNPFAENSAILRVADTTVKSRTLLETDVHGHAVCYRRVKRTNELVIDGNVYDEIEMLMETAHALHATVDGHEIVVGYDGVSKSYVKVDGVVVGTKLRLI